MFAAASDERLSHKRLEPLVLDADEDVELFHDFFREVAERLPPSEEKSDMVKRANALEVAYDDLCAETRYYGAKSYFPVLSRQSSAFL